jgi:hypothetical protein
MGQIINTGEGGIDNMTSRSRVSAKQLIEAWNISLNDDGKVGEISSLSGTAKKSGISIGSNFRVLGGVDCYGYVDYNCTGIFTRVEGITFIFYDDQTKGRIVFYDIPNDILSILYASLPLNRMDDVDMVSYNDREISTVYFVNENIPYSNIDIRVYGPDCQPEILEKDLSARPVSEYDILQIKDVVAGGSIPAGKVAFSFRYVSTTKNRSTKWSPPTPVVPIYMERGGGYPGQKTDRKVILMLNALTGFSGFDKVQLCVIKYQDGSALAPLVARVLPAMEIADEFEYTGEGINEIEIPIEEVVVDDMALLSARTIAQEDNRNFLGAFKIQGFEEDNGKVTVQDAYTIRKRIEQGTRGHYGDYRDDIDSRGYFRGELYAYGACYEDDYGNSVVVPLDLSAFGRNLVIGTVAGSVISSDPGIPETILTTGSPGDPWRVGDFVRIDGVVMEVVKTMTDFMLFQIAVNAVVAGPIVTIERLRGQVGNQAESWAYKFASREDNQFSLLGVDGDPEALGLRIIGLKNHPSWATRVRIVRRKRVRDILYQTIHVPVVPVRGFPTSFLLDSVADSTGFIEKDFVPYIDYEGTEDTLMPKMHYLGAAKNISFKGSPQTGGSFSGDVEALLFESQLKNAASSAAGASESPRFAFLLPPEYLYNIDEEPFRGENLANAFIDVVDGVMMTIKHYHELLQKDAELAISAPVFDGTVTEADSINTRAILFDATDRRKYFTTREGQIDIFGDRRRMRLTTFLDRLSFNRTSKIRWQLPIINGMERQVLVDNTLGWEPYSKIKYYGGTGKIAIQAQLHPSMPSFFRDMFLPVERNCRGLLVSIEDVINDFTLPALRLFVEGQGNFFPLINYDVPQFVTDEFNFRGTNTIPFTDISAMSAAYILNVRSGVGDKRYGNITDQAEWIDTGAVAILTPAMIAANVPLNFDVFGGDCYINKHLIKVSGSNANVVRYYGYVELLGVNTNLGSPADFPFVPSNLRKVGNQNLSEIIEVWLESEVNAANEIKERDEYPLKTDLAALKKFYTHRYNGSYSAENNSKIFVSPDQIYKAGTVFDPAFCWSDRRVRGAIFNDLLDLDGSRRIRVNNFNMLSGENGSLIKLLSMGARDLYAVQEDSIRYFPVGVDELSTADGVVISTGTGKLLGSGAYDLYSKFGIQSLHHITKMNGLIYGIDAKRATAFIFGVRGEAFTDLSEKGEKEFLRQLSEMPDLRVFGEIQFGRFGIYSSNGLGLIYKRTQNYFESRLRTPHMDYAIGTQDKLLLVKDGSVYMAYDEDKAEYFGVPVVPEFSISINANSDITKLFQVIEFNADERLLEMRATIHLEDENAIPIQDTGWITLDKKPKNRLYYENHLRSMEMGRSKKMIGTVMTVQVRMKSDIKASVRNIKTTFRKSF